MSEFCVAKGEKDREREKKTAPFTIKGFRERTPTRLLTGKKYHMSRGKATGTTRGAKRQSEQSEMAQTKG